MAITTENLWNVGTGTQVRDDDAVVLYDDDPSVATDTGDWVEVDFPLHVAVEAVYSDVSGSGNTVSVEIQGTNLTGASPDDLVSYGLLGALTSDDEDIPRYLEATVLKQKMRAVVVGSGTITTGSLVVTVRDRDYKRDDARSA